MKRNSLQVYKNVLEAIGNTPMIRLNKIVQNENVKCQLWAKCEFLNPGGSVKDRIGVYMLEKAEKEGIIKKGFTIVEGTSGNTGVGLALACLVKGYNMTIVMPDKMSDEKQNILKALGCELVITPTSVEAEDPRSYISVSKRLGEQDNFFYVNQYQNSGNFLAHHHYTGKEIYEQMDGKIDYVFIGAGTGGTITGIAQILKKKNPNIKIIGIDHEASKLAQPESLNTKEYEYKIEGLG